MIEPYTVIDLTLKLCQFIDRWTRISHCNKTNQVNTLQGHIDVFFISNWGEDRLDDDRCHSVCTSIESKGERCFPLEHLDHTLSGLSNTNPLDWKRQNQRGRLQKTQNNDNTHLKMFSFLSGSDQNNKFSIMHNDSLLFWGLQRGSVGHDFNCYRENIQSLFSCVWHTGNSDVVLDEADVVLSLGWEVIPLSSSRRVSLPTREGLILDLYFVQNIHVCYYKNEKIKKK